MSKPEEYQSKQLRVGIAGYGVVGKRRHQFIDAHPALKTVAVCDKVYASEPKPVRKEGGGLIVHEDYRELLAEDLDVLFVCLPNYIAPEVTIAGLEKGLHVFCEKPPGRTVADMERVIAVAQSCPELKLKYGFNHRYHDSVRDALKIVESGEMGPIVNMRGVYGKGMIIPYEEGGWRSERRYAGGGILLDQGIHMLDLLRLFGGDFSEVKSFISNDYWKFDVEDNAYAILRSQSGVVAMLHSSATQWQHRFSLEIAFAQGYLKLEGILSGTKSYGEEVLMVGRRTDETTGNLTNTTTRYLQDNSWRDEINEFAGAITGGDPVRHGLANDALETMRLLDRIYKADGSWTEKWDD
ncbi:MAG: Gfo/Idh/MocA family oxidoreductase [bacterium]|nr:Gfo/Idh/MocA family oxidoreductase [bacterium]